MQAETETEKSVNEEPVISGSPEAQNEGAVTAESVTIRGKATTVNAKTVKVEGGQIGALRGDDIDIDMQNGGIGALFGNKVRVDVANGGVGSVIAREATVSAPAVSVVTALNVSGDIKPKVLIDMRAGLVAGIAFGLVLVAFKLIMGRRTAGNCACD